ncbi:MAG: enolase C-terminal domain-like protein [Cyclobacteriaceae bacterium]
MNRRLFLQTSAAASLGMAALPVSFKPANRAWADELNQHTIKEITFSEISLKWPRQVGKNARLDVHGHGPSARICQLTTDQGASGWGHAPYANSEIAALKARLLNQRVGDCLSVEQGILNESLRVFDLPLHDLAGIILNKPVYQLLGAKAPFLTKCYSGMIYFDELEPENQSKGLDTILEECQWDYDYGYRQFKLKIGRGQQWMPQQKGLQRDIEVTRLVAEHFPDCDILVDANDGYSVAGFIQYLEGVQGIPLFWVEEPFPETRANCAKLKEWMQANGFESTYLADGEFEPDIPFVKSLAREQLIDVCLFDIVGYGFTPWRKLMPELQSTQTLASPHAWGTLLKSYYIAHLAGGLGNTCTVEGATCLSDQIDFGDYQMKDGQLIPSPQPGFGMTLHLNK